MSDTSLDDVAKQLESLRGEMIRDREFLQSEVTHRIEELRNYADLKFLTRDDHAASQTRLVLDVVRDVSGKLQAMMRDAMQEVAFLTVQNFIQSEEFKGEFNDLLDARKDLDRKERVEDFRAAIGSMGRLVAFVNPLLSLLLALFALWAIFFR